MTDGTLDAQLMPDRGIGILVDSTTPRFPGKQVRHLGFGADLPPHIEVALLATMALRPAPSWFDRTRFQADTVREDYRSAVIKHYGDSNIPLSETRLSDVSRRLHALQPERVYGDLSFEHVQHLPIKPERLTYPAMGVTTSWRHSTFARIIIGERLYHLRTTEMADPDAVWRRILALFMSYCATLRQQPYQVLPIKEQRREMAALYFAAYEQLLFLRLEEATRRLNYIVAVFDRQHDGSSQDELILGLEPNLDDGRIENRLTARRAHYRHLIEHLQHLTANGVMSLVNLPVRS